jgi:hypothetical protein
VSAVFDFEFRIREFQNTTMMSTIFPQQHLSASVIERCNGVVGISASICRLRTQSQTTYSDVSMVGLKRSLCLIPQNKPQHLRPIFVFLTGTSGNLRNFLPICLFPVCVCLSGRCIRSCKFVRAFMYLSATKDKVCYKMLLELRQLMP